MGTHWISWVTALWIALSASPTAARQTAVAGLDAAVAADAPVEVDRRYEAYGFVFEQCEGHERYGRLSEHEVAVLGAVIVAYADLAGGPEVLAHLVDGPVRVRRDRNEIVSYTQAGQVIGLGRGAFDLQLTWQSNYYTWGATSGDELAQIVFGHEIGHRWINALRQRAGVDWAEIYQRNVWRGERASSGETWASLGDAEEEAVTNLALYALGKGYRWTFLHDGPATEARQMWIDGWVTDLAM